MDRPGPHERGIPINRDANKGPGAITKTLGAYKEMSDKESLAYKLGNAYGTLKKHRETSRIERIERREKELPIRERELALKEREAKLNARKAKIGKSGSGALGGIVNALGQAFGPEPQHGKRSGRNASTGPVIPDPFSSDPYHKKRR